MSSINATISAQLWLPLSRGKGVFTSFVPIGPGSYQQASPTGNPNDALHAIYANTPISRIIPAVSTAAPVVFTPASISQLKVWFSGDVGLTSSTWTNQATGGPSTGVTFFSAGTTLTTVNGLGAMNFGYNSYGMFNMNIGSSSRSMFCVLKTDSQIASTGSVQIISQQNVGFDGGYSLYGTSATTCQNFLASYGQAIEIINTNGVALTTTNLNLLGSSWEASSSTSPNNYVYINSALPPVSWSADAGFYDAGTTVQTYLGSRLTVSPPGTVGWTLCEICIYGRSLTPAEGAQLQSYLKAKWNSS